MISKKLYVGFHWGYSFKWEDVNDSFTYTEKANNLLSMMDAYGIEHDGLDDFDGTTLYIIVPKPLIDSVVWLLDHNDFGDWLYYSYMDDGFHTILHNEAME